MDKINHKPNFNNVFSDKRLDARGNIIGTLLASTRTSSIKGSTKNEAEQKGFYRFLENPKIEEQQLVQ